MRVVATNMDGMVDLNCVLLVEIQHSGVSTLTLYLDTCQKVYLSTIMYGHCRGVVLNVFKDDVGYIRIFQTKATAPSCSPYMLCAAVV